MGRNDFADILRENLAEETATSERLGALGDKIIHKRAAGKPAVRTATRRPRAADKAKAKRKAAKPRTRKTA
jgi:hypothetical protein